MEQREETPASEVIALVDAVEAIGATYQINGGWGVDALVGRQTRPHQDVDLFIDGFHLEAVLAWLEERGYQVEGDYMPVAMQMIKLDPDDDDDVMHVLRVDVHPMVIDDEGSGFQSGEKEQWFVHPANLRTTGVIEGRSVVIGNREHLEALHRGYTPRDVDLHDLMELERLRAPRIGGSVTLPSVDATQAPTDSPEVE